MHAREFGMIIGILCAFLVWLEYDKEKTAREYRNRSLWQKIRGRKA